jgi:hypothetical protein
MAGACGNARYIIKIDFVFQQIVQETRSVAGTHTAALENQSRVMDIVRDRHQFFPLLSWSCLYSAYRAV